MRKYSSSSISTIMIESLMDRVGKMISVVGLTIFGVSHPACIRVQGFGGEGIIGQEGKAWGINTSQAF